MGVHQCCNIDSMPELPIGSTLGKCGHLPDISEQLGSLKSRIFAMLAARWDICGTGVVPREATVAVRAAFRELV